MIEEENEIIVEGPKNSRRKAREIALQSLYALEMGNPPVDDYILQFGKDELLPESLEFALKLAKSTVEHMQEADDYIQKQAQNWKLERVASLDRNILRMAITEILHFSDIPPKVTINEAVELAKKYSTEKSGKFVNGILDPIAREKKE